MVFFSCAEEHEIGKIEVEGLKGVFVHITQDNEFDSSTGVHYEIIIDNEKIILTKSFLMGSDYIDDSSLF